MTTPNVPNFTPGVGRLVTDRYDFESHIDGANFRHQASQIDLFPTVVIGTTKTTVQDAIAALAVAVSPPVIQQATPSQLGIIQLNGDIGGFATNVLVTGLQGRPISNIVPAMDSVLAWNGTSWSPTGNNSIFIPGGDIGGSNVLQKVIGLSGDLFGTINATCSTILFDAATSNLFIGQAQTSEMFGGDLTFGAQPTVSAGGTGGSIALNGGATGTGGTRGGVSLQMDRRELVGLTEPIAGQRVLALVSGFIGGINSTQMPAGTGDLVMYVGNTSTPPTSGSPVNGAMMYASGGQMYIKQADGNNFAMGSIPNPSTWGPTGQQTYSVRNSVTSTNAAVNAYPANPIVLADDTATRVDVIMVGKASGAADSAQYNLSIGYVRHGGAPVSVGGLTIADPRTTAGANNWNLPNIVISGNNVVINTGFNTGTTINWTVITQLTTSLAV